MTHPPTDQTMSAGEMSEQQAFEVHVAGPDDVHRFTDELAAYRFANSVNLTYLDDLLKHPGNEVLCLATVHGRAALPAAAPAAVPGGWRLVPDSATHNMLNAANQARKKGRSSSGEIYSAMLAAAPPAHAAQPVEPTEAQAQLMRFYGVPDLPALIDAQAHHIERLQAKLPKQPSLAPTFPRG